MYYRLSLLYDVPMPDGGCAQSALTDTEYKPGDLFYGQYGRATVTKCNPAQGNVPAALDDFADVWRYALRGNQVRSNMTTTSPIAAFIINQFNRAVINFRRNPNASNYITLTSAMLAHQQAAQLFAYRADDERRARAIAMCDDAPEGQWANIVVEVATGKSILTHLQNSVV